MPEAWGARNCRPARCWLQPGGGQDPPDRAFANAVTAADKFALDAPVAPARVLPGQLLDEFAYLVRDRRASRGVRVSPFLPGQALMPGEEGARGHDSVQPEAGGQQPSQSGDHCAVGPVRPRAGNLTAQDEYLVPKYQDLRVLRGITPGEEDQPAEQPDHEQVDKADEHDRWRTECPGPHPARLRHGQIRREPALLQHDPHPAPDQACPPRPRSEAHSARRGLRSDELRSRNQERAGPPQLVDREWGHLTGTSQMAMDIANSGC